MWMRRRSVITGLIVEALRVLHETVGVLSDPEHGADMRASRAAARMIACEEREWQTQGQSW